MNKSERVLIKMIPHMTHDSLLKVLEFSEKLAAEQEQHREAIKQAVAHASFADVDRGAMIMEEIKIFGKPFYDKYKDSPFIIAGLAFAAGIAEGKQRERDKRRYARMKAEIRATRAAAKVE